MSRPRRQTGRADEQTAAGRSARGGGGRSDAASKSPTVGGGEKKVARSRRALVVTGMHRSGTSAFARVFSLLGARLPDEVLRPEATAGNPLGFWEPARVVELHDELLRLSARTWFDLQPFAPEWFSSDLVQSYAARLANVVREEYGRAPLLLVKDPRISRLVPLWLDVFERLEIEPLFVIALRNPLEVAASHQERDRFRPPLSQLLWLRHMLDAERDTRGERRVIVSYADLVTDWRPVVDRVCAELGVRWPRASRLSELEIDGFLDPAERHHVVRDAELEQRHDVSPWVRDAYRILLDLSGCETQNALCQLDVLRQEIDKSELAWGSILVDSLHRLRAEREQAREQFDALRTDRDRLAAEVEHATAQRAEADARQAELATAVADLEQANRELERLQGELASLTGEAAHRDEAIEDANRQLAELQEALAAERARVAALEPELTKRVSELETLTAELGRREEELSGLRQQVATLEGSLQEHSVRADKREKSIAGLTDELEQSAAQIESLRTNNERLAERLATNEAELARKAEALELFEAAQASARTELEALRRDAHALEMLIAGGRIRTSTRRSLSQLASWLVRGRILLVVRYLRARKSADIDGVAYLLRNEDVARAGLNPVMHFVEYGRQEGRDASPRGAPQPPSPAPTNRSSPSSTNLSRSRWRERVAGVVQRNLSASTAVCLIHVGGEDDVDFGSRQVWRLKAATDATELVGLIEEARAGGATHVLVTADALPMLEARRGLFDYLSHYAHQMMRRDRDCALFSLPRGVRAAPANGDVSDLVSAGVPAAQGLVLIGSPQVELPSHRAWRLPGIESNGVMIDSLEKFRTEGARYLVLAADQLAALEQHDDLKRYVESRFRAVLRRDGVGVLYEALGPIAAAPVPQR